MTVRVRLVQPNSLLLCFLLWSSMMAAQLRAQGDLPAIADQFRVGEVTVAEQRYAYRLLEPLPAHRSQQQPLVVFLHGAGERGDDNIQQLRWLPELMVGEDRRERFPCYLLAVQCPAGEQWVDVPWGERQPRATPKRATPAMEAVLQALDELLADPGIDPARVYVTGLSMGGYGAWDLIVRRGDQVAAAVPVCGGGHPSIVRQTQGLPIELWHAANDTVVPVERARLMVAEMQLLGIVPRYFEDAHAGHAVWRKAYADGAAIDWMFAQDQRQQRRGAWSDVSIIPRPDVVERRPGWFALRAGARCVVPAELRGLASYFLDQLAVEAVRRPGLVTGVAATDGDLELVLQPEATERFVIDVRDRVRVIARDAAQMKQALAALFQLLRTLPGDRAPRGTFTQLRDRPAASLCLEKPTNPWSSGPMASLLREAWLGGVDKISFRGGAARQADLRAYREFAVHARRLGIQFDADWLESDAKAATGQNRTDQGKAGLRKWVSGDAGLAATLADTRGAEELVVVIPAGAPADMLVQARQQLAAAAEGAMRRDGPIHVGAFLARLATMYR